MRLIDVDALVSALNNGRFKEQTGRAVPFNAVPFNAGVAFALTMVEDAPTIDAVPVRHGRWEKNNDLFLDTLYRCSVCGEEFYLENGTPQENQYYYCPNCGAKMDEEVED